MSRFTIYTKTGSVRNDDNGAAVVSESLDYSGSWMGECFVTVTVKSAYPVNFQTGDYIMYRGEKFVLNYDPGVVKKARRGTYGEGFTYDGIKFNAVHYELTDVMFLDYVLGDNQLHYTSLPVFPFYAADIDDYCDRLQANTNRWCESNNISGYTNWWMFVTPSKNRTIQRLGMMHYNSTSEQWEGLTTAQATAVWENAYGSSEPYNINTDEEKKDVSVSISNENVWNSLSRIKSDFGLCFITRTRQVIIGSGGIPTDELLYGKGNGLYEIERIADTEQQVITKLYCYGSEKNLPVRYYANLNTRPYLKVTGDYHSSSTADSLSVSLEALPYNSGAFINNIFDNGALRWYTMNCKIGNVECGGNIETTSPNGGTVRLVLYATGASAEVDGVRFTTQANIDAIKTLLNGGTTDVLFMSGVDVDKFPADRRISTTDNLPNNMAVNRLMLPGFPNQSLYDWVIANGGTAVTDSHNNDMYGRARWTYDSVEYDVFFSKDPYQPHILSPNFVELGIREASKTFDGSDGEEEIYPTIEGAEYNGHRIDVIAHADVITDNGVFAEGADEPYFDLYLPDFGSDFDLKDLATKGTQDGGSPTIYLNDGYCGAREFQFADTDVTKVASGAYANCWKVHVKREHDDLLDLWFPYSYNASIGQTPSANEAYQVRGSDISGYDGDHYVLTGIPMTSTYVNINARKLLGYSLAFLAKNDYTRYTYMPRIDEIFMARDHAENGNNSLYMKIKEGDLMLFSDTDLGIDGSVFIDSLQIKENGNANIPTFQVTLRDDKQVGTIQRMQEQISSLSSSMSGGGINVNQIRELIEKYGAQRFLSKVGADTAQGLITFLQGLRTTPNFTTGDNGQGAALYQDGNNKGVLEADLARIRDKILGILRVGNASNNNQSFGDGTTVASSNIPFKVGGNARIDNVLIALAKIYANLIESDNFNGDGAFDTGFMLSKSKGGVNHSYLVVDELFVRMKAIFNELEIRKISYSGGNIIFSHAGGRIVSVKTISRAFEVSVAGTVLTISGPVNVVGSTMNIDGGATVSGTVLTLTDTVVDYSYRCYMMKDDGTTATENWWHVNDQARCQTFNVVEPGNYTNVENTYYWRRVLAVGYEKVSLTEGQSEENYDYVDLSVVDCDSSSGVPQAGDQIVQLGNRTDTDRQGFVSLEVSGEYAPAFKVYKNVTSYTLEGKRKICLSPKLTDLHVQRLVIETDYDAQPIPMERGAWSSIPNHQCYYYNVVQHNGSSWLCIYPESGIGGVLYTTEEPSDTATYWQVYAKAGKDGQDGKSFNILGSYDTVADLEAAHPTGNVGDAYIVAGYLYVWDEENSEWHNSGKIQGDPGRGIASVTISYGLSESSSELPEPESWSGTPTPTKGYYLWMRTIYNYTDGTSSEPSYTVTYSGIDGTSPITAVCDNEMMSVALDKEGNAISGFSQTVHVQMFNGSQEVSLDNDGLSCTSASGISIGSVSPANGTFVVSIFQGASIANANNLTITAKSTISGNAVTRHIALVVNGVRTGADGTPATIYDLVPSTTSVIRQKDGTYSVNTVSCTRQKTVGNTITADTTDGTFTYSIDGGTEQPYDNNVEINVSSINNNIVFILRIGGTIVDKQTISVITNGYDAAMLYLSDNVIDMECDENGIATEDFTEEVFPSMIAGAKYIYIRSLTVSSSAHVTTPTRYVQPTEEGVFSVSGTVLSVSSAEVTGTQAKLPASVTALPHIMVSVAKGTSVTEGNVTVSATGIDKDGNEYTATNLFKIVRKYYAPAFQVILSPSTILLTQNMEGDKLIDYTNAFTDVLIRVGATDVSTGFTLTATPSVVNNRQTCNVQVQGNRVSITAVNTTTASSGVYFDQGYVDITATYNGQSYTQRWPFYCNLLGTWTETVEGDMETIAAQSIIYTFENDGNDTLAKIKNDYTSKRSSVGQFETWKSTYESASGESINSMNTRISTAEGNISTVTKKVNGGKNLLQGVLTATGWKSGVSVSALTTNAKTNGEQWILVGGDSDTMLKTTLFNIESGKTYKISFDTESTSSVAMNLRKTDGTNISSWNSDSGNTHHTTGFEANYTGSVYLVIATTKLRYPQVEEGNVATSFDAGDREVSSSIIQTADKIELEVSDVEGDVSNLSLTVDGITSTVKKLTDGKNILSGVLTGENWKSASRNVHAGGMSFSALKGVEDYWFIKGNLTTYVASPIVAITEGKTYTLSFDAEGTTAVTVIMYISSSTSETLTTSATSRRSVTFESGYTGNVRFLFQVAKIRYPQLELGDAATTFDTSAEETSSCISQTADEIDLSITTKLGETGINIDGNNREINLIAGKVNFKDSTGATSPYMSIDNDGKLIVDSVQATNGDFSGQVTVNSLYHKLTEVTTNTSITGENLSDTYRCAGTSEITINLANLQQSDYEGMELTFINTAQSRVKLSGNYFCFTRINNSHFEPYYEPNNVYIPAKAPPVKIMLVRNNLSGWGYTWYVISGIVSSS